MTPTTAAIAELAHIAVAQAAAWTRSTPPRPMLPFVVCITRPDGTYIEQPVSAYTSADAFIAIVDELVPPCSVVVKRALSS